MPPQGDAAAEEFRPRAAAGAAAVAEAAQEVVTGKVVERKAMTCRKGLDNQKETGWNILI